MAMFKTPYEEAAEMILRQMERLDKAADSANVTTNDLVKITTSLVSLNFELSRYKMSDPYSFPPLYNRPLQSVVEKEDSKCE